MAVDLVETAQNKWSVCVSPAIDDDQAMVDRSVARNLSGDRHGQSVEDREKDRSSIALPATVNHRDRSSRLDADTASNDCCHGRRASAAAVGMQFQLMSVRLLRLPVRSQQR